LCELIARKLRRKWSPQQIAGWLKRKHPDEKQYRVSHETIYRCLYVQTRRVLKKELQECLRSSRAMVLPLFSSGLFRAMFALMESKSGNEIHRRVSA